MNPEGWSDGESTVSFRKDTVGNFQENLRSPDVDRNFLVILNLSLHYLYKLINSISISIFFTAAAAVSSQFTIV